MISALLLRPLLKLASSPAVAATAASWGINTLQANVAALAAASDELGQAIAARRAELEDLDQAIAARRAELEDLDQASAVCVEPSEAPAETDSHACHNPTLHGPHRWHMRLLGQRGQLIEDSRLVDCPGVTTAPPPRV